MASASTAAKRANPILVVTFMAPEVVEGEVEPEVEVELAPEVRSGTGGPVAVAPTPAITGPLSGVVTSLLPIAFAAARNVGKVFPVSGALILPTIPNPQCRGCLQKYQMGVSAVTLMVKVDPDVKLESKPAGEFVEASAARYVHGFAKVD